MHFTLGYERRTYKPQIITLKQLSSLKTLKLRYGGSKKMVDSLVFLDLIRKVWALHGQVSLQKAKGIMGKGEDRFAVVLLHML